MAKEINELWGKCEKCGEFWPDGMLNKIKVNDPNHIVPKVMTKAVLDAELTGAFLLFCDNCLKTRQAAVVEAKKK